VPETFIFANVRQPSGTIAAHRRRRLSFPQYSHHQAIEGQSAMVFWSRGGFLRSVLARYTRSTAIAVDGGATPGFH
jgi:hypothetical protein